MHSMLYALPATLAEEEGEAAAALPPPPLPPLVAVLLLILCVLCALRRQGDRAVGAVPAGVAQGGGEGGPCGARAGPAGLHVRRAGAQRLARHPALASWDRRGAAYGGRGPLTEATCSAAEHIQLHNIFFLAAGLRAPCYCFLDHIFWTPF